MEKEPTHIIFSDYKIVVSTNLSEIFSFLTEIDGEVKRFLNYQEKIKNINKGFLNLLDLIDYLSKTLQENNIPIKYEKELSSIDYDFEFDRSIRSEMIILFSYLETIRVLWTAYEKNTTNESTLRNTSDNNMKEFFKKFCTCKDNRWVKGNPKRAARFGPNALVKMRNSLTHFFSVGKLGITANYDQETMKMEKLTKNKFQAISSADLLEIIEGGFELLIIKWNNDYQNTLNQNDSNFEERINCVKKIVKKYGAISINKS